MAAFPTKALDRDSFWPCLTAYMLYIYGVSMLHYLSGAEKQRKIHYGTFAVSAGVRTPVPDLQVPET